MKNILVVGGAEVVRAEDNRFFEGVEDWTGLKALSLCGKDHGIQVYYNKWVIALR